MNRYGQNAPNLSPWTKITQMTPRAQKPPKLTSLVKNPPNELPWPRMPRITPPWSKTPFKFPCNFHTPALRHVRSLLTDDVAQTVACRIVVSRLAGWTTAMHCWVAHRRRLSIGYSAPRTTWPEWVIVESGKRYLAAVVFSVHGLCLRYQPVTV